LTSKIDIDGHPAYQKEESDRFYFITYNCRFSQFQISFQNYQGTYTGNGQIYFISSATKDDICLTDSENIWEYRTKDVAPEFKISKLHIEDNGECGTQVLGDTSGKINLFGKDYPANLNCEWMIEPK